AKATVTAGAVIRIAIVAAADASAARRAVDQTDTTAAAAAAAEGRRSVLGAAVAAVDRCSVTASAAEAANAGSAAGAPIGERWRRERGQRDRPDGGECGGGQIMTAHGRRARNRSGLQ